MADIELIIKIDEEQYRQILSGDIVCYLNNAVKNGIPLTDCEDTINRSAVIETISDKKAKHIDDRENNPINYGTLLDLERDIRTLPSVNPTPDLNKIRAEIKELYRDRPNSYNHPQRTEFYAGVLAIIDKYKAEMERE